MKVKIPTKCGSFSFSIGGKELWASLKTCDEIIKFSDADKIVDDLNLLMCCGKQVYVVGRTIDTFTVLRLPCTNVEGEGAANIDFNSFQPLAKKDSCNISVEDGRLCAKSKSFVYKVDLRQGSSDQLELVSQMLEQYTGGEEVQLSHADVEAVNRAVQLTYIPELYLDHIVCAHIQATAKGLTVSCPANWSSGHYFNPNVRGKYKLSVSAKMMAVISKVGTEDTSYNVGVFGFMASSPDRIIVLPPITTHENAFTQHTETRAAFGKPQCVIECGADIVEAVNTINGIVQRTKDLKGRAISAQLKSAGKYMSVGFVTDSQSILERVTGAGDVFEVNCDIKILALILKNVAVLKPSEHTLSLLGPRGKYKALALDYGSADGEELSFMQSTMS